MSMPPQRAELTLQVSRREVLRNLGYPRSREPSPRVAETLGGLWAELEGLLKAQGIYRLVDGQDLTATGMPRPSPRVGLGICTIGPELERRGQQLSEEGHVLEALIFDAFGSAAAEAAADALNTLLCAEARAAGLGAHPRVSPGYSSWDVSGQRALFDLLPGVEPWVTLTEGMMMVPCKSVSFAVRLESGAEARGFRRGCATCEMETCRYRDDPDQE